jgi:hypothetical protein
MKNKSLSFSLQKLIVAGILFFTGCLLIFFSHGNELLYYGLLLLCIIPVSLIFKEKSDHWIQYIAVHFTALTVCLLDVNNVFAKITHTQWMFDHHLFFVWFIKYIFCILFIIAISTFSSFDFSNKRHTYNLKPE